MGVSKEDVETYCCKSSECLDDKINVKIPHPDNSYSYSSLHTCALDGTLSVDQRACCPSGNCYYSECRQVNWDMSKYNKAAYYAKMRLYARKVIYNGRSYSWADAIYNGVINGYGYDGLHKETWPDTPCDPGHVARPMMINTYNEYENKFYPTETAVDHSLLVIDLYAMGGFAMYSTIARRAASISARHKKLVQAEKLAFQEYTKAKNLQYAKVNNLKTFTGGKGVKFSTPANLKASK